MIQDRKNIVIAGAGIMGSSLARLFAGHGYAVTLYDVSEAALEKSRELIRAECPSETDGSETLGGGSVGYTCEMNCFSTADFVIEAIVEKMEIKHEFWKKASALAPARAVLTSNTSGLSLTQIAKAVRLPERFCGMHWLNPPHICPLVEVVRGEKTDEKTADVVFQIARDIRRYPVRLKKETPGFLINRFQFAVLREAMSLVEEGVAEKEDIDAVFRYGLGLRYACLGPFEIADLGGLDTFYSIAQYLFPELSDAKEAPAMLENAVKEGRCGVKSGRGFYEYGGGRDKEVTEKRDADFLKVSRCLYKDL